MPLAFTVRRSRFTVRRVQGCRVRTVIDDAFIESKRLIGGCTIMQMNSDAPRQSSEGFLTAMVLSSFR